MLPCPGIVNSAAMNIGVHVSFQLMVFSRYTPRSEIAGSYGDFGASLIAQLVKNPPAMQETWVRSPGWEDPLENGTHSGVLAWRISWSV